MFRRLSLFSVPLLCSLQAETAINSLENPITINSILKTKERVLGLVNLTIGTQGELSIPTEDMLLMLEKILPKEVLSQLKAKEKNNQITDLALKELGFPLSLNSQTFELLINIPIDQNRINAISLAKKASELRQQKPSDFNGYINTHFSIARDVSANDKETYSQSHRIKAGLNHKAANITYEAEFLDTNNSDAEYNRTFTQLSYDLPEQGTRIVAGDIVTPTTSFQSGTNIAGIGIVRNFSDIPTKNLRTTGSQQFSLSRKSSVDVIVDGIVVQRLTLPAGRYDINDIPLARGNNNVQLKIQDEAGNEESISFSIAIDNNLIKQGEYEYAITAGVPSKIENNKLTYDNPKVLSTGFLEYGFLPSWTLGVSAQHYDENLQFGLMSLNAWPFGTTEFIYNRSLHTVYGGGDVFRFTYSTPEEFEQLVNFQLSSMYEYFSPYFSQVDASDVNLRETIQHNLKLSILSSFYQKYHAGLNFNIQKGYQAEENSWSVSTSLTGPIADTDVMFGLYLRYITDFQKEKEFDITANISYTFKNNHHFLSQYRSQDNELQFDYSYKEPANVVGSTTAHANIVTNKQNALVLNAEASYSANRFNVGIEQASRATSLNSKNLSSTTRVTLDTAIAFSGNKVAVGRPVGDSFAVISPNKNLKNTAIHMQPNHNGKAHSISNKSRNVLVSNLTTYISQSVDYEVTNLPAGYDLGAGVFTVKPMKGQGYQFNIGTDNAYTLMAVLFDKESNKAISLVSGSAYKKDNPAEKIAFFSTKRGRIAITGMSKGDWVLTLNTKPVKTVTLTVQDNPNMLDQKGKVYVN